MVAIHARSYGAIFSTLRTSEQIEEAYEWVVNNDALQARAKAVTPYYTGNDSLKSKIAAAIMPGFLFYDGFYLPSYLVARGKLLNTAGIIRLILRDKVIHNYYSGHEYQLAAKKLAPAKQVEMKKFASDFLDKLIDLEKKYLHELYDDFDLVDDAIHFSLYNAGKFLQNLGYDSSFTAEEIYISLEVFAQLLVQVDENRSFFSGNGPLYVMGTGEETKDDDWDF